MPAFRGQVNSAQGTTLMPAPTTMLRCAAASAQAQLREHLQEHLIAQNKCACTRYRAAQEQTAVGAR